MVWGIIAALDAELELIVRAMEVRRREKVYGVEFYIGSIGESEVAAVCSSVGTINAAVCASAIIREFGAQAVINIGVAGSVCEELRVLDVVLSDEVVFHDAQLDVIEKYYPFRRGFPADAGLSRLAEKSIARIEGNPIRYKKGRIATGDVFVSDSAVKTDIVRRLKPLCVEMEGAAIGQVAYMNATPFLVIRTVSDSAGEDAAQIYDSFLERAAKISAGIALGMIGMDLKDNAILT